MIAALVVLAVVAAVCAAFVTACVVVGARAERRPQPRQVTLGEFFAGVPDAENEEPGR